MKSVRHCEERSPSERFSRAGNLTNSGILHFVQNDKGTGYEIVILNEVKNLNDRVRLCRNAAASRRNVGLRPALGGTMTIEVS
jgi:hypothetical protein